MTYSVLMQGHGNFFKAIVWQPMVKLRSSVPVVPFAVIQMAWSANRKYGIIGDVDGISSDPKMFFEIHVYNYQARFVI